jgi:hypothetical protein
MVHPVVQDRSTAIPEYRLGEDVSLPLYNGELLAPNMPVLSDNTVRTDIRKAQKTILRVRASDGYCSCWLIHVRPACGTCIVHSRRVGVVGRKIRYGFRRQTLEGNN